jgi:cell division cycle protein 37
MSGFNYSKWDNIELSDDEDDLHPNIDKESWFRMKHRSRLEREEREDQEVKHMEKMNAEDAARMKIIQARVKVIENPTGGDNDDDAEFEDVDALKSEYQELRTNTAQRMTRIDEIKERRKWNIDNICQVSEERTIVSKSATVASLKADDFKPTGLTEKAMEENKIEKEKNEAAAAAAVKSSPAPATSEKAAISTTTSANSAKSVQSKPSTAGPAEKSEKNAVLSYNDYVLQHEDLLEQYSEIADMEKTKQFLFHNCDILLHEHSQSYMLLSCLEDEMNGKSKRMKLVCRQSQILSHVQELGQSMQRDPRDVVLPFFNRIEQKEFLNAFLEQVRLFEVRIKERAVVKRKEMDAERRITEAPPLGPGGLDPYEVLESLPQAMQDAFESQDIGRLQSVLNDMPNEEASMWMKKCVDSGLWNPGGVEEVDDAAAAAAAKLERELDPLD